MYEQNIKLIRDLISRRESAYGILSFMEDTISSIRADLSPDTQLDSYPELEKMADALEELSGKLHT
ncbi:MAG: hypothetical protein KDK25_03800 [Leptospiraceae bacterium]|nr:hypothetical protein [Leptospiraceae bacterium]